MTLSYYCMRRCIVPRRILLYTCPHTTKYVSAYYYTCVLIPVYVSSALRESPRLHSRATLINICPHTTACVSSYCHHICALSPHTATIYVSSSLRESPLGFTRALKPVVCGHIYSSMRILYMCPHTTKSSRLHSRASLRILLYMCPHTTQYV
jgi:hypothetical protein